MQKLRHFRHRKALNVIGANKGLAHAGGVDVQLQRYRVALPDIPLKAFGDHQGKGMAALVQQVVDVAVGHQIRRQEPWLLERIDDAAGQHRLVFVHHGDRCIVKLHGAGGTCGVDHHRKRHQHKHHQCLVLPQAAQFLDAEVPDVA